MFNYLPWTKATLDSTTAKAAAFDVQLSIAFLMVVLFLTALSLVFLIPHQAGARPRDPAMRRLVYWVLCLVVPLLTFPAYILGCLDLFALHTAERQSYIIWTSVLAVAAWVLANGVGYVLGRTTLKYSKLADVFASRSRR